MFPAVNLGPLVIPTAAFVLILGAWLCLWVAERSAIYLGRDPQLISNLVSIMLVVGVVGARLTFVLIYWPAYRNNLLGIIWPLNSGFNLAGGLFFGLAAGFFYARYRQMAPWPTLDVLAPVAVVGLMVVSLADFLGGPGYGEITGVAWGITQFGLTRHPVQLYELLAEALALVVWWALSRRSYADGQLFLVTTALLALGRLLTDAFRENV